MITVAVIENASELTMVTSVIAAEERNVLVKVAIGVQRFVSESASEQAACHRWLSVIHRFLGSEMSESSIRITDLFSGDAHRSDPKSRS